MSSSMPAVRPPSGRALRHRSGGALLLAGVASFWSCAREPAAPRPLNVVIVVLDTLRPDRLGCYGSGRDTSPNLDAMAHEFFLFEAAQTPAPWTAPSLVSLMTSLYPEAHGVLSSPIPERLSDDARTLAEVLRDRGYATLALTEGGYARGDFGLDQGFDRYHTEDLPETGSTYEALMRRLETNLETAERWLAEQREQPFLFLFHTFEVHSPRIPPAEYLRIFRPDYDFEQHFEELKAVVEAWNEHGELDEAAARRIQLEVEVGNFTRPPKPLRPIELRDRAAELGVPLDRAHHSESPALVELVRDLYDAELRRTDELLTRLWDALRRNGQWDNTLLVLVSDHGEGLGNHGRIGHGFRLHESVLRILLMMRVPGTELVPRRVPDVVRLVDVMPTILELTGAPTRGLLLQGESLVPLMRGEPSSREAYSHAVKIDGGELAKQHTIRTRNWRLIVNQDDGIVELFDLRQDPGELVNVAEREPEVVRQLSERLERQRAIDAAIRQSFGRGADRGEVDAALLRELEGLGYIGNH